MTTQEIGERLRTLRGSRSLQEVYEATGIKPTTLCMYEKGNRRPPDETKQILANYYKKSVNSLFFASNSHEK